MPLNRIRLSSVDSTNTWSKAHFPTFDPHGYTLVSATTQTAGRGRDRRVWHSPADKNLYVTWNFLAPLDYSAVTRAPQALSLAITQVLQTLNFPCQIKWPNDLVLAEKKLGGILTETIAQDQHLGIIMGLGLNINSSATELANIGKPATSLFIEGGNELNLEALLQNIHEQFVTLWEAPVFPISVYRQKLVHRLGDPISFHNQQHLFQGTFLDIEEDGTLKTLDSTGKLHSFRAGEIA